MKEEILSRFDLLVAKIAEVSPKVWAIYIKQQYIEGIVNISVFIIFLIPFIISLKIVINNINNEEYYIKKPFGTDPTPKGFTWAVIAIITGFITVISLLIMLLEGNILKLFNPEYYAIKDLLNL